MKSSENFVKQYKAFAASQWHARQMEFKFMAAVPAVLRAVRLEMGMTPVQFGALLGMSGPALYGVEDGYVTPEDSLLRKLVSILEEREG